MTEMMDNDALVILGARVNPEQSGKLKVTLVMAGVDSTLTISGLGTIAPQLFNMESHAEPEKQMDLKLNLYQLENF